MYGGMLLLDHALLSSIISSTIVWFGNRELFRHKSPIHLNGRLIDGEGDNLVI